MPDDTMKGQPNGPISREQKDVVTFDVKLITIGCEELGAYSRDGGGNRGDLGG